jgi:hypothetical protein
LNVLCAEGNAAAISPEIGSLSPPEPGEPAGILKPRDNDSGENRKTTICPFVDPVKCRASWLPRMNLSVSARISKRALLEKYGKLSMPTIFAHSPRRLPPEIHIRVGKLMSKVKRKCLDNAPVVHFQ